MRRSVLLFLSRLLSLLFLLLLLLNRLLSGLNTVGGHGPLGDLHADTVLAGLDDQGGLGHLNNTANDTADGGDGVTLLDVVTHLLGLLLALVLGTDQQEIEDSDHRYHHYNRRHTFSAHSLKTPFV